MVHKIWRQFEREGGDWSPLGHLQDVADDAEGPHVREASDGLVADDFGRDEFGRAEEDANGRAGLELARQTEVDEFDVVRRRTLAEDVLRLEVEVDDVLRVHVADAVADLAHE